jgi:putative ABC transport system permease protein
MLKHHLKMAIRNLIRHKSYSFINIVGLAIGLGMAMVSVSYVVRELSWEDCHQNRDSIFRVEMRYQHADTAWSSARVMAPLGDAIAEGIPGVERVAVFRHESNVSLQANDKDYQAGNLIFAEPDFFEVFTFPLKTGNPVTCLRDPKSVLVTDSIAKVCFPHENPIGKTIGLIDQTEYTITGILQDLPALTQLHCDFVASYATLRTAGANLDSWTDEGMDLTYLLLDDEANPELVEARITDVFSRHVGEDISRRYAFSLKPLKDIYFSTYYSGNRGEIWPGGEYDVMIVVICIGLFILVQAMVNFVSLSTARAVDRMKEVGVRKTFGAARSRLVAQFLGESITFSFAATIIGLFFYDIFRKGYTKVTPDKYELLNLYGEPSTFGFIALLAIVVGILAGLYPALYLSRFKPISVLQGGTTTGISRSFMRKSLVAFQFTLAIFFISVTLGLHNQLNFLAQYNLGFERKDMMILRFYGDDGCAEDCALAKNEILARNDVLGAARSDGVLGGRFSSERYYTSMDHDEADYKAAKKYTVDYDFLSVYEIDVVKGRGFSPDRPEDIDHSILINESMMKELELSNPVGHMLYTDSAAWEIIGVVKDFQGTALDWSYRSTSVVTLNPDTCRVLCVKLRPDNISGSVAAIRTTWERIFGDREFSYSFLDDDIRAHYSELDSIAGFFLALSLISIIIACLGIFGLVSYTVERKTKDIAIRKVLGASVTAIQWVLTKELVIIIALANVIACPLACLMVNWSLEEYPLRASFGIGTYVTGGLLTILLALGTSVYHVMKAARANPVETLRYE